MNIDWAAGMEVKVVYNKKMELIFEEGGGLGP